MPEMKKLVLKVDINDLKEKQKAMKSVSSLSGIDSLSMDMKDRKLTVVGDVDPVEVVNKLRKNWHTEIVTVGPAKEPEKKKEDDNKKKEDDKKKDDDSKKKKTQEELVQELVKNYQDYNPYMTKYYVVHSAEENPNSCVIS